MLPHSHSATSLSQQRAACMRDLARLKRLKQRHLFRVVTARATRGAAGFGAGLFAAMKVKIAATISGKLLFAALIAMGFIWPAAILWIVVLVFLGIAAVLLSDHFDLDPGWLCPDRCLCGSNNARRRRLIDMIEEREEWLRHPKGPIPSRRSNGSAR